MLLQQILACLPFVVVLVLLLQFRRIQMLHKYRMDLLAFSDFGATPEEKLLRLIWAMNQPRWTAMAEHRGEWDEMLVGHYAPDFIAWRQINL